MFEEACGICMCAGYVTKDSKALYEGTYREARELHMKFGRENRTQNDAELVKLRDCQGHFIHRECL